MDRTGAPAPRSLVVAAFAAVCLVWGSTYLGIRVALESFPPYAIGAARFVAAGAALYAVARLRGERSPTAAQWGSAAVTGALFFVIGNGLVNVAEKSVSSGLASVLVATMPLWATLFARLSGTTATRREVAGVVLGLVGVAVLNLGGELRASPGGAACALLAPMGWALGSVASGRLPHAPGVTMRTATQMVAGGVAMAVLSAVLREHLVAPPTARSVGALVYLAVFGSLVGFTAFSYLLAHVRPAVATSYAYVNPVIAVVLGVLLAHESFGPTSVVGSVIVLAAVVLVRRGKDQSRASATMSRSPVAIASGSPSNRSATPDSVTTT